MPHAPSPPRTGSSNGLAYTVHEPAGAPRAAVVVMHGAGSRKENHADFGLRAQAAGLAALTYDARGHGESDGAFGPGAIDDALAMVALAGELAPAVALRGSSLGGFCALHAAARASDVTAVVAVCPPAERALLVAVRAGGLASVMRADRDAIEAWLPGASMSDAVRSLAGRVALMIVHAEGDEVVPVAGSRELYAAAGEPKELLVAPGGDHRSAQHDPELQDATIRFIAEAVGLRASRA